MKIYTGGYGDLTVFVTPGAHHPTNSDWMTVAEDGEGRPFRKPIQFTVKFERGVADVPDSLGEYMIDQKLARRTPQLLILPPTLQAFEEIAKPKYATPIPVGRPLAEVLRQQT